MPTEEIIQEEKQELNLKIYEHLFPSAKQNLLNSYRRQVEELKETRDNLKQFGVRSVYDNLERHNHLDLNKSVLQQVQQSTIDIIENAITKLENNILRLEFNM
jgi:hypothetical protein